MTRLVCLKKHWVINFNKQKLLHTMPKDRLKAGKFINMSCLYFINNTANIIFDLTIIVNLIIC